MGNFTGISRLLASADKSQDLATLHFHMTTIGWSLWVSALCMDHVPLCSSPKPASFTSPAKFLEVFAFVTPDYLFPGFPLSPSSVRRRRKKSPRCLVSDSGLFLFSTQPSSLSFFGMWFPYIQGVFTCTLPGSSRFPLQPFPTPQDAFQKNLER